MSKNEVAKNVASKLIGTERAVDDAMVQASQLLEAMIVARRELNYAGPVGEVAQARVAEAIGALSESRRAVMAAHAALEDVRKSMNIPQTAVGDAGDKPPQSAQLDTAARLRVAG